MLRDASLELAELSEEMFEKSGICASASASDIAMGSV